MDGTDFLIRENNRQRIFLSESNLDVGDILKTDYSYIYDSIQEEEFILKYSQCSLFKELVFDNKVVGFCSYDFSREFITAALNNIYILPEFRGNGIFLSELQKTMMEHNKPSIMEPTRLIVEILIKYGFARKITDNIVASAIEFIVPGEHVLSNGDYDDCEELSTHFYDLSICASFHILDLEKCHIAYSSPLNYDIVHYCCAENRSKIGDEYFSQLKELFVDRDIEMMETILELEGTLSVKNYTLEEIIGKGDKFSFYIETLIDDAHVTYEKALEIKQQIREEYESGMILKESLLIRLAYLFYQPKEPSIKSHDEVCPYCRMPIDSHDKYCHFCGINLEYDPDEMEMHLLNVLDTSHSDFEEDIRFVAYKFLKLIDSEIDFDYSVFTTENTYNIIWEELKSFLDANGYLKGYEITEEGHDFLNAHPLHFWEKYHMDAVDYTDFENYFYRNPDMEPREICLSYLEQFDDEYVLEIMDEIKNSSN